MTTRIVAFPPVGIVGWAPRVLRPVERSFGLFTGKRFASAAQPERRLLTLTVSALSLDRAGAGYIHQLLREIDGGVHLVRVQSQPVNWWMDRNRLRNIGGDGPLTWADGTPVTWDNAGTPVLWFSGYLRRAVPGTSADGYPTITVPDTSDPLQVLLPPGQVVARPGDIIRVYPADDRLVGQTAEVVTVATAGADGVAVIKLVSALPAGIVSLADTDTRVYAVMNQPDFAQPLRGNWSVQIDLREVLASEIPAGAEEWNPW